MRFKHKVIEGREQEVRSGISAAGEPRQEDAHRREAADAHRRVTATGDAPRPGAQVHNDVANTRAVRTASKAKAADGHDQGRRQLRRRPRVVPELNRLHGKAQKKRRNKESYRRSESLVQQTLPQVRPEINGDQDPHRHLQHLHRLLRHPLVPLRLLPPPRPTPLQTPQPATLQKNEAPETGSQDSPYFELK